MTNMTPTSSRRTAHKLTSIAIGVAAFWWGYWYMGFSEGFNIIISLAVGLLAGFVMWRLLASRGTDSTTRA
jgi:ABC-type thiamin/hydroxymethylpyrimidine transport system permease subunit